MKNNQPEYNLLLTCCPGDQAGNNLLCAGELVAKGVDWTKVLWLARLHGVETRLYQTLKRLEHDTVPENV
jgi:hypothetical protein